MVDPEKLALLQKVVNDRAEGSGMSGGELLAEGSGMSGGKEGSGLLSGEGLLSGGSDGSGLVGGSKPKLSKVLTLTDKEKAGLNMEEQEKLIKDKQDKVKKEKAERLAKIKADNPDKFPEKGSDAAKQRAKDAGATKTANALERAKTIELEEKKSGMRLLGADRIVFEALLKSKQKNAKNAARYQKLKDEAKLAGCIGKDGEGSVSAYQKKKKEGSLPESKAVVEGSGKGRTRHPALDSFLGV